MMMIDEIIENIEKTKKHLEKWYVIPKGYQYDCFRKAIFTSGYAKRCIDELEKALEHLNKTKELLTHIK